MRAVTYVFKPHVGEVYGGERSCAALLGRMDTVERAAVVNRKDGFAALVRASGVPVRVVAGEDPFHGFRAASLQQRLRRIGGWLAHNARLLRVLRHARPDVVHANDVREVMMGGIAFALLRRPVVTHVRCEMRMRPLHQAVLWASAASISVSRGILDSHLSRCHPRLRGRIARRSHVIYNGVDLEAVDRHVRSGARQAIRRSLRIRDDDVLALVIGAVEERKGQLELVRDVLPRALADVPRLRVLLVGGAKQGRADDSRDAGYSALVEQAVVALQVGGRVRSLGFRSDVHDLLTAADLILLPSKQEGLPRSVIEAGAFGVPAVAFGVSGTPETIIDGESGFAVAAGDMPAFSEALARLATDATLRSAMGRRARELAEARFDPDAAAARTAALLTAVAAGRGALRGAAGRRRRPVPPPGPHASRFR